MCLSAGAMLALSLAGTAASSVMQAQSQQKSMRNYNNQVAAQNDLLQRQFTDRQNKINSARDQQAALFKEISDAQDAEFAKQTAMAKDKERLFQEAASRPILKAADSPEFQQAVDSRNRLFADTVAPANYNSSDSENTAENRVLRAAAEDAQGKERGKAAGMAGALAKMSALQDNAQGQTQLFRDLNVGLGDAASNATQSMNMLNYRLRAPQYRMGALSNVMGEQQNMPYFRGNEPTYKPGNTLFADLLGGASSIGANYAFRQPATPVQKPWVNPDTGQRVL